MLGDTTVGKSSILERFTDGTFKENAMTTIGVESKDKKHKLKNTGEEIKVKIWDTAGQERFRTITQSFYRNANGVIIVFDVSEKRSFDNVSSWLESVSQYADAKIRKILVGNKIDLEEKRATSGISTQEG